MIKNVADLIAESQGTVADNLTGFHATQGVSGSDSWHAFYVSKLGHDGSLADLMYEYWVDPGVIPDPDPDPDPGLADFFISDSFNRPEASMAGQSTDEYNSTYLASRFGGVSAGPQAWVGTPEGYRNYGGSTVGVVDDVNDYTALLSTPWDGLLVMSFKLAALDSGSIFAITGDTLQVDGKYLTDGYQLLVDGAWLEIYRRDGDSLSLVDGVPWVAVAGDTIEWRIDNGAHAVKVNGVSALAAMDATYASGSLSGLLSWSPEVRVDDVWMAWKATA